LIAEEKTAPPPLSVKDWFIWNICTMPELRRKGIASILLKETIKCAKQMNVGHLLGSCTNMPARLFWLKHNFCYQNKQKMDDGDYSHMIFYRVNKTEKKISTKQENYQIAKADSKQLDWIFDEYIVKNSLKFFHDKRNDIIALAAVDEDKKILGFITAYAFGLGSPLEGTQWTIPYIFVRPELRKQGIACALITELAKYAKEADITQLACPSLNEEESEFWHANNFDILINYIAKTRDGKNPISAALRIRED
jgi:ribosomal protein S18 acetylase RimI-like enzyme